MTAYISRPYDHADLVARLRELRPEFNLPERSLVTSIDLSPPVGNGRRVVELTVEIPLDPSEIKKLLDNPLE